MWKKKVCGNNVGPGLLPTFIILDQFLTVVGLRTPTCDKNFTNIVNLNSGAGGSFIIKLISPLCSFNSTLRNIYNGAIIKRANHSRFFPG